MSYNKAIIAGNLGADPDLGYLQSGTPVCTLSIATNEGYTDRDGKRHDQTEWHRIKVFGKNAENSSKYLSKGSQALVEGRIQTRSWEDDNGQRKYVTEIIAQRVVFLRSTASVARAGERRETGGGRGDSGRGPRESEPEPRNDDSPPAHDVEDDIPF